MESLLNIGAVDLGSWTTKVAALSHKHRFQILVNEANFRQTPSVVGFTNAQRLIGDQAVIKMKSNYKNTVRSPQRLIGLASKPHLLEQQLKFSTVKHRIENNKLMIQVQQDNHALELTPEQILIALMTKVKTIFEINQFETDTLFLSIQSYLSNGERKAIKACAQATGFRNANLIEQWEAISAEYCYVRQKDIQALSQDIVVIFVDLGYDNFAIHACTFSKNRISLLDQQYLRFSGAKNIDNLLVQYYIAMVQKQSGKDVRENPKALVKLQEAVQIQRKKLSANIQNQLTIQCLIGDYDLSYNMKRQQLQNIAMPVLADLASAMQNLRSRVEPLAPIHSVQILGGLSRMPFAQEVVRSVFNMEPSKKMNASQSVARGCSIAAASRLGMLKANMCNFVRFIKYPIFILIHNIAKDNNVFGKRFDLFKQCQRKNLFDKSSILPANSIPKIDGQGQIQVLICQQKNLQCAILGYLNFKGPDNLTILIDNDGILRARLMKHTNFDQYDLGDLLSVQNVAKFKDFQQKMRKRDQNILQSYQIKNQFQSLLYSTKQNIGTKWTEYSQPGETVTILQIIAQGQQFLSVATQHSIQNFKQRIQTIIMLTQIITTRAAFHQRIKGLQQQFNSKYSVVSKLHPQPEIQAKIQEIRHMFVQLYNQQATGFWDGKFLSEQKAKDLITSLDHLK